MTAQSEFTLDLLVLIPQARQGLQEGCTAAPRLAQNQQHFSGVDGARESAEDGSRILFSLSVLQRTQQPKDRLGRRGDGGCILRLPTVN